LFIAEAKGIKCFEPAVLRKYRRVKEVTSAIEACLAKTGNEKFQASFVVSMLDEIFRRGMYIHSMEAFEVEDKNNHRLRLDLSILGLDENWDSCTKVDAEYARRIVEAKLAAALKCENEIKCEIWLDDLNSAQHS